MECNREKCYDGSRKDGDDPKEEIIMILADKIITLRKKNGLSQEELAEKMETERDKKNDKDN